MSKSMTCAHFGESVDEPVRTVLLLRAWACDRMRRSPWTHAREWRVRQVVKDEAALLSEVADLTTDTSIMGNEAAYAMLRSWRDTL